MENEICKNCKKKIPISNIILHIAYCARFLSLCSICNEPVPKSQFEEHQKGCNTEPALVVEETKPSTNTTQATEEVKSLENLEQRLDNISLQTSPAVETIKPPRSRAPKHFSCRYCNLDLSEKEAMKEHEYYCGSRTDICENCGKRVILKNFNIHISTGCRTPSKEQKPENPKSSGNGVNQQRREPKQVYKKKNKCKEGRKKSDR